MNGGFFSRIEKVASPLSGAAFRVALGLRRGCRKCHLIYVSNLRDTTLVYVLSDVIEVSMDEKHFKIRRYAVGVLSNRCPNPSFRRRSRRLFFDHGEPVADLAWRGAWHFRPPQFGR